MRNKTILVLQLIFRKVADVKRERELSERQKDNPPLDLPSDHPLRKLISRFRKKSDRNLLSPSADLELGETSSCINALDEHAPKRKSASAETINSDLQNTYNCSSAFARRGTLMPGAVPSASTRQGSWYQKRGSGAVVQHPVSQQDPDVKVDPGKTSEEPGKLGVPSFQRSLESSNNRTEDSSGGPEETKKGELLGVTRMSLSCSKRPASKWGRLLSGTKASAASDATSSVASATTQQPTKELGDDDTQLARDSTTCVVPKTINRRPNSKEINKAPKATSEQVTNRRLTDQAAGSSQSDEMNPGWRLGTEPGASTSRDGGTGRGEQMVDGSLELHVCEILRDLKSEILGVHQRIQKVEAHLEDVFRLFQHPSAVSASAVVSPSTPVASLITSPRELSLNSPCSQLPNPAVLLPTSTDESQVSSRLTDNTISFRVSDETECVQSTSTKNENSHHSSKFFSDSQPPVLFPRQPSTRIKTRSPTGPAKLTRKRTPPSPIPSFLQNPDASSSATAHASSVTSVDEPLLLENDATNSTKTQTEVEAEDSPLTSGLPEALEKDDFRNGGDPLDSTVSTSNQNLANFPTPGEATTNSTCSREEEIHSTADKDSF